MQKQAPSLITVGVIAEEVGTTPERVRRLLNSRKHIRPAAYAGQTRLFTSEAITQVRDELNQIDARRRVGEVVQ